MACGLEVRTPPMEISGSITKVMIGRTGQTKTVSYMKLRLCHAQKWVSSLNPSIDTAFFICNGGE